MKKKFLLAVICLFIFTGCEVKYDLDLDRYIEDVTIEDGVGTDNQMFDVYSKKPIPLSNLIPIESESDDKKKNVDYYDVKDISSDNSIGLKFSGVFGKDIPITQSTLLKYGTRDVQIIERDNTISINEFNRIKLFDQFSSLDKVTVNIISGRKMIESNADKVSGSVYTWIITRDNYMNKTISIVFSADKGLLDPDSPIMRFSLVMIIAVIIGGLIYLFVRKRMNKANSV